MQRKRKTLKRLLFCLALIASVLLASMSAPALAAGPPQQLKGKRFQLNVIEGSFTVPKGWSAKETPDGIHVSNSQFADSALALGVVTLTQEQRPLRIDALVWQVIRDALGELPMKQLRAPTPSQLNSMPIASLLLGGVVNGVDYRARAGAIRLGGQLMVFVAVYPASDEGTIGPVFDTTMLSFRGKESRPQAPKNETRANTNHKLTQQVQGCWRYRTSTGGGTGSSNTTKRLFFGADGRYTYTYRSFVSTPYGSSKDGDDDEGRYSVTGTTLTYDSDRGAEQDASAQVGLNDGFLFVGSTRYIPCS